MSFKESNNQSANPEIEASGNDSKFEEKPSEGDI